MLAVLGAGSFALAGTIASPHARADQHRSYLRIGEGEGARPLRLGLNRR
jgi:hypothetical protein